MAELPKQDQTPESAKEAPTGWLSRARARASAARAARAEEAPPPPLRKKRKGGLIALFSGLMTVGLVIAVVGMLLGDSARREFSQPGPLPSDKIVMIEKGSTTEEIVETLQREGVVSHPKWLWVSLFWRDILGKLAIGDSANKRVKAGEYLFKKQASLAEVVETVTSGRSIEHSITIPEGLTSEQIVERLRQNDLLAGEITQIPAEGSLLPDTYRISRGTSREALIARMSQAHKRLLNDVWNKRAKDVPVRNPRELVTLASIVEKETGKADERPRVAGVFINRLEKKMKLQSDPTIIYGIVGGKGTLGRPISRADIDRPTAYNTYTIAALPPGPIANPGRAALEAVANPSKTRDLFFVADGTGGHAFAETLEQHNRNVARWRQIEASRPAAAPSVPAFAPVAPAGGATPTAETTGQVTQTPGTQIAAPLAPATPGFTAPQRRNETSPDAAQPRAFDLNAPRTVPQLR